MLSKDHRLTIWKGDIADMRYTYASPCHKLDICPDGDCIDKFYCAFGTLIDRLAEYEDTRMLPNEILKMKHDYKNAIEKKRKYRKKLIEHDIDPDK